MRFFDRSLPLSLASFLAGASALVACGGSSTDPAATGGVLGAGGSSGGASSGGTPGTGGATSGGAGGAATGGTGGAPSGSGGFFGASRCESGDFLLCDGFESAAIDAGKWTVEKAGDNVLEITTEQAARGAQSIHIRAEPNQKFAYLKNTSAFPVPNNDYYGRMFLRVARYSTVDWAHWTIAEAAGTGDGSLIRVGGQYKTDQAANRWGVGSDGGPTGDWTTHDSDPDGAPLEPPTNTWTCLEWAHLGSTEETRFSVDGVEHPSLATTANEHGGAGVPYVMPEFTSVWFGWYQYQTDPVAFDVWIDEVALDDEPIGCER